MNEVTAWETREFAINATTKLVADVFTMKDQLFANLRKFEVVDANATVSRETDSDLDKICMDFIRHRDNIDHINAISLVLNKCCYFEIYEHPAFAGSAESLDKQPLAIATDEISRFKPSDVISTIFRDGIYEKDDMRSLDYYPIYKFFGSKKSAATPHVVHFDLLVWMLMKKFTSIRAELTKLLTVDIQLAAQNHQTVADYSSMKKQQLIDALKKKDDLIAEIREDMRALRTDNEATHKKLDDVNDAFATLRTDNEATHKKLDDAKEAITNLTNISVDGFAKLSKQMDDKFKRIALKISDNITTANLTTGTAVERLLVIKRPKLTAMLRANGCIKANQEVFDTISCQKRFLKDRLRDHEYDPETDEIVAKYKTSNSIDLSYFFKTHFDKSLVKFDTKKGLYVRKIVYKKMIEQELLQQLDLYVLESTNAKNEIIRIVENNQRLMQKQFQHQVKEMETKLNEAVNRVETKVEDAVEQINEKVDVVIANQNTILQLLQDIHPNATAVWYNHAYRKLSNDGDRVYCAVRKDTDDTYELTEDDVKKWKFK